MINLYVKSLPLRDVIRDLAEAMGTTFDQCCDNFYLNVPSQYGKGTIEGINFKDGLGFIHYRCFFNKEVKIHFTLNKVHPLKFLFCYDGMARHKFEKEKELHTIDKHQNAIVASQKHSGHVLYFEGGKQINLFSLEVIRSEFANRLDCDIANLDSRTEKLFRDIEAKKLFYYNGFYSLKIASLINEIVNCEDSHFLYTLFLEGKSYQFLAEQIKIFQQDQDGSRNHILFGKYELEQLSKAAGFIEENINLSHTVKSLSKQFGLNPNKLQRGFKTLFNKTINSYVQQQRVKKAAELLTDDHMNIAEVADKVGIRSKSYFTKSFKKEFGLTPKEFQKKRGNQLNGKNS
jgi:AraC-like DNA-binding protein